MGSPQRASPGKSQQAEALQLQVPKHRPPSHFSCPTGYVRCCKQALRKKPKIPKAGCQTRRIGQGASKPGGVGLDSLPREKKHSVEWKPEYLEDEGSSLLGHICWPRGAGAGTGGLLPASPALPEAVSNRGKPALQGHRDTPLFAKLPARLGGLFHRNFLGKGSLARMRILE